MTPEPGPPAFDPALAEIQLRIRQGQYADAAARLDIVKAGSPEDPAVWEVDGDLAFAQRRYRQAQTSYRRAHELDPTNGPLEEKFALAVVKVHEPDLLAHQRDLPDDDTPWWAQRIPRSPTVSGLLSALIPGVGQCYNGELLRGGLLIFAWLMLCAQVLTSVTLDNHGEFTLGAAIASLFHGVALLWTLLLLALWLFAIIDAARRAQPEE
jgi:hypothetical protein